ncbi:MAG: hypothetical protein FD157_4130 [Rhodocyclaceae bacterium]|nr:MAG: hypothetical protein FD157_4130 [Rhodocyclaceae bacterium]TNC99543.1 MAG: hypothetical protein FD118_3662 [Rhodocyclaceae bacterium]
MQEKSVLKSRRWRDGKRNDNCLGVNDGMFESKRVDSR